MTAAARKDCERVVQGNIRRADGTSAPLGEVVPVTESNIKDAFIDFFRKCAARETATITHLTKSTHGFALSQRTVTTGRGAGGGRGAGKGGRGAGKGGSH